MTVLNFEYGMDDMAGPRARAAFTAVMPARPTWLDSHTKTMVQLSEISRWTSATISRIKGCSGCQFWTLCIHEMLGLGVQTPPKSVPNDRDRISINIMIFQYFF